MSMYDPRDENGSVNPADVLDEGELQEYYSDRNRRPRKTTGLVKKEEEEVPYE